MRSSSGCGTDDCGRTSAPSRPSTMPSPPSTLPSDARGRRSSAFVRERHTPIDACGRPASAEVADKEPSLGAFWALALAFNLAAALLAKVRPWLGLLVVPFTALWA